MSEQSTSISNLLNNLKSTMLNIILKIFIQEIADKKIKQVMLKYMMIADRSLLEVYTTVKKTYRTKTRMIKLRKKERRIQDLEFYKRLIQQNMSLQQVKALQTAFHTRQFQI